MKIADYISSLPECFLGQEPWQIVTDISEIITGQIAYLSDEYIITDNIAIHKSVIIEQGAILKGPCIIGPDCFIAAYAYLRNGVWLEGKNSIGPAVEVKSSFFAHGSKAAHFNFIGDSLIGRNVNLEAGAIIANHRNELDDKEIICFDDGIAIQTGIKKFGALIGDDCRIGANAVLAPGTLLMPKTIIERLALIDQTK